jgi:hypothetical protein
VARKNKIKTADNGLTEEVLLEDRCDAYLEGRLSPAETARFEQDLLQERVARAFREALILRELLSTVGPDAPEEQLIARIEAALDLDAGQDHAEARRRLPRLRAAMSGLGWIVRGPAQALQAETARTYATREVVGGFSTMRYALGPLATSSREPQPKPQPKPAWWRRVLRRKK